MRVIAVNGSPDKAGNTYHALKLVTDELEKQGIDTEIVHVGNKPVSGCIACKSCIKNQNDQCALKDDGVNACVKKIKEADGFLLGSPVHFAGISGAMKSFLDRLFYVSLANNNLFRHKVGGALVAVRRTGGKTALNELYNYLTYGEILVPTSNYWSVIHGMAPKEVLQDTEGVQIMQLLGKNMAWLLQLKEYGKDKILPPAAENKIYTNFIR